MLTGFPAAAARYPLRMTTRLGQWLSSAFGGSGRKAAPGENDTEHDPNVARSRSTGGERGRDEGDSAGTTGPGENETFVGRVAGGDIGDTGETGAEARAERDRSQ